MANFVLFLTLATNSTHLGENSSAGVVLENLEDLELVDVWTWRTGVRVTGTGVLASPPPTSPPLPSPRTRSSPMHSLHVRLDRSQSLF